MSTTYLIKVGFLSKEHNCQGMTIYIHMCSLKLNERFIKRLAELTQCTHIVQGFNSLYTYRLMNQLIVHISFKESTNCTHIVQRIQIFIRII